jgi:dTDP-4-amino-4,6-dideoxygalactose transaminase
VKRKLVTDGAAFDRFLHVGTPNQGDRQALLKRINGMLDRNWLTNRGPLVEEFEEKLAQYLGVRNCITMCNGTVALEIAIKALGLEGEVIVPSMTFIATAHALNWQGITPIFCDIDPETLCIDPLQIEKLITEKTTGIIGVHLYGDVCDIRELQRVAERNNLKLMFDAAHAFGCSYEREMIGNFGSCEVFSFHATKFFNTFEGGAVATNDDDLAKRIRLMQNFGFAGLDNVIYPGTNGKMTEICAAAGLVNFESLDTFIKNNLRNYECYLASFASIQGIQIRQVGSTEDLSNFQYIIVEVTPEYPLSRDELMEKLHKNNVLVRRYFWPGCHRMEPYKTLYPDAGINLPVTENFALRILVFPTGSGVDVEDIQVIAGLLQEFGNEHESRADEVI